MGRPLKDRIGEHAGLLAAELRRLLKADVEAAVGALQDTHARELTALRRTVDVLERRVAALLERERRGRSTVGRWVPGGPGRPPKDAAARIAAFNARHQRPATTRKRGPRPRKAKTPTADRPTK